MASSPIDAAGPGPVTVMEAGDMQMTGIISGAHTAIIHDGHKAFTEGHGRIKSKSANHLPQDVSIHSVRHTTMAGLNERDTKAAGYSSLSTAHSDLTDQHGAGPDSKMTVTHFSKR